MTQVLVTVDAELASGCQAAGMPLHRNLEQQFFGVVGDKAFGVSWLMAQMSRRDIKGVFFIDPMPGLLGDPSIVEQMVTPILEAGHEVQLYVHTEWLNWAADSPIEGRTGRNIGDFSLSDQIALLDWGRMALVKAGAPQPIAFRAGNFGANDDTLRALDALGLRWDSSFNADYVDKGCRISLSPDAVDPVPIGNVLEIPVAGIWDRPGHFRPAQVCAISSQEMRQSLHHAAATGAHSFVAVTHSFEMLSRDRQRPNFAVMRRFSALCDTIARHPSLVSATFRDLPVPIDAPQQPPLARLGPSRVRTFARTAEQALATWLYERKLLPV